VRFEEYGSYRELFVYLQDIQNGENTSQEVHFSSQPEYESFVRSLAERGLDKVRQERPQHYRNYMQAGQNEEALRQPVMIAYFIQMAVIFLIRIIFVGFWNAVFNALLWGVILGADWSYIVYTLEDGYVSMIGQFYGPVMLYVSEDAYYSNDNPVNFAAVTDDSLLRQ